VKRCSPSRRLEDGGPPARRFQPARVTRAHLLDRLGRSEEAMVAYDSAIDLTHDGAERQYLRHRRDVARYGFANTPDREA